MLDFEQPTQVLIGSDFENVIAFRNVLSHAADVMTEMAFGDELRQNGLFERWRMAVDQAAGRCERLDEALGQNHEPETQPVEEYLREGACASRAGTICTVLLLPAVCGVTSSSRVDSFSMRRNRWPMRALRLP